MARIKTTDESDVTPAPAAAPVDVVNDVQARHLRAAALREKRTAILGELGGIDAELDYLTSLD